MRLTSFVLKTAAGALITAACLSTSASALSCMRPDLATTMEEAKASDDVYYVLHGTFQTPQVAKPKSPRLQKPRNPNAPSNGIGSHTVAGSFDGRILSNDARYDHKVSRFPVDIAVSCAGPWCGGAPGNGQEVIAFVKMRAGQPMLLEAGPCPDKVHNINPGQSQIKMLRDCFTKTCAKIADPRFTPR